MRLRFQKTNYLYVVESELNFEKRGICRQITYYGSDSPVSEKYILDKAEHNIKRKFEESAGSIISLFISRIYH